MPFEAVLLDPIRGHHKYGVGATPVNAICSAFRKYLVFEKPEPNPDHPECNLTDEQWKAKVDMIGPTETIQAFCLVSVEDEFYENPKTLREDVCNQMLIVRVDRTKENMYTPVGWVRPKLG